MPRIACFAWILAVSFLAARAGFPQQDYEALKVRLGAESAKRHLDYATTLEDRRIYLAEIEEGFKEYLGDLAE